MLNFCINHLITILLQVQIIESTDLMLFLVFLMFIQLKGLVNNQICIKNRKSYECYI